MKNKIKLRSAFLYSFDFSVSIKDPSALHLYKEIVNFYITQEIWYLPIEVSEDIPLMQIQSNIVQCCLLMEGLGYIAQNLQCDYDRYLLKTLYIIIERAGMYKCIICTKT